MRCKPSAAPGRAPSRVDDDPPVTLTPSALLARHIALGVPALLLGGAYIGQYAFDLYPCEMCLWQRWPHFAALGFALLACVAPPKRLWTALAAVAVLVSGAIGAFHAGVEYGWWDGITGCATTAVRGEDLLDSIISAPVVRCDQAPWSLLSVSLAGWNFLISGVTAIAILMLLRRSNRESPQ